MEDQAKKVGTPAQETSKDGKKEEAKTAPAYFESIALLPMITVAQNQNGLRHKDYKRYQNYCSRKLRKYSHTWLPS